MSAAAMTSPPSAARPPIRPCGGDGTSGNDVGGGGGSGGNVATGSDGHVAGASDAGRTRVSAGGARDTRVVNSARGQAGRLKPFVGNMRRACSAETIAPPRVVPLAKKNAPAGNAEDRNPGSPPCGGSGAGRIIRRSPWSARGAGGPQANTGSPPGTGGACGVSSRVSCGGNGGNSGGGKGAGHRMSNSSIATAPPSPVSVSSPPSPPLPPAHVSSEGRTSGASAPRHVRSRTPSPTGLRRPNVKNTGTGSPPAGGSQTPWPAAALCKEAIGLCNPLKQVLQAAISLPKNGSAASGAITYSPARVPLGPPTGRDLQKLRDTISGMTQVLVALQQRLDEDLTPVEAPEEHDSARSASNHGTVSARSNPTSSSGGVSRGGGTANVGAIGSAGGSGNGSGNVIVSAATPSPKPPAWAVIPIETAPHDEVVRDSDRSFVLPMPAYAHSGNYALESPTPHSQADSWSPTADHTTDQDPVPVTARLGDVPNWSGSQRFIELARSSEALRMQTATLEARQSRGPSLREECSFLSNQRAPTATISKFVNP
eukprot:TRINITY_DN34755_c0_g1_i1.p1 TRINITY_DN34755_c0_g1~~TRINITY_DN34755_c0_g1_i1.p1  ORF type:complete len:542 (+),score=90.47 TRINITY_DN34755_c0_g1_i1:75-1700(+)